MACSCVATCLISSGRLLERHLRARGIGWVEDESNQDVTYRRNLLRHEVVPVLLRVNPACIANARKTAQLLAEEGELLDALAKEAAATYARGVGCRLQIDIPKFRNYNNILRRRGPETVAARTGARGRGTGAGVLRPGDRRHAWN